ncbi:MAG: bifunctional acetate--CoA ligase family protein/GNAT family N-acetyltransferase [Alphaproteobacteria bacterium]|nr:bifunctional acetate--CoA ligase family protein/GNAT family N-acetyltransferase [Alphaproteobacteria bacterium]MDE2111242.1 bifunctional acetate--CoA ligase family protein/GNAT family N-acetyltransferase [Alphaproteobacteria bacterium]MDE2492582.1 bifunctional acetate--CoA ligase family protein/GNAT family N-acetyltransferase [Alphaproteobacteria bacterium]
MSVRNLDAFFHPKSIALIGARKVPHSVGAVMAANLLSGGFNGPIMPVNPRHRSVNGVLTYPDVKSLPVSPDLAVVCTPPDTVPGLIAELAARGTKAAIVVTAGFSESTDEAGHKLERDMLAAARPSLMRIVGPNCLGVLSTPSGVNASFAQCAPRKGKVAFVAQSGAMVTTVMDWAAARGLGFSHLVSLGDMADVDFGDMLDYLANDPDTDAILLYIEAITHSRKFMSAARSAARVKPVIAIKAGRSETAARAAASHTGALAGVDAVYDAAFQRSGILRAYDLDEVFDAVETLSMRPRVTGDRLAIVTNGGGVGVLAVDALSDYKGTLAELTPKTIANLNAVLPQTWSHGNPIDIIGDAGGDRYGAALNAIADAPDMDGVLVLHCPVAVASGLDAAKATVNAVKASERAVLTSWLGSGEVEECRSLFQAARIPTYETPEKAVRGFMHLARYARGQNVLMEVPASAAEDFVPDEARARAIVNEALAEGQVWLDAIRVARLFECYAIPSVRLTKAATPDEVARKAQEFGVPVVIKILSPDITHKSDVGGVDLDIDGANAARASAEAMLARVAKAAPKARIDGFLIQEMVRRPRAYELIVGMAVDKIFGPFLLFGQGGVAVEVIADKALALAPLNMALAKDMVSRTRIYRQLKGYRDRAPAALDDVYAVLVRVSQLICDFPEIIDLDINPLLADANGVIAVDARIKLVKVEAGARDKRLAIKPYPKELEHRETIPGLGEFFLRPVRPQDAAAFTRFFARLSPDDVRLRFFSPLRSLPANLLARLTQIDYDRDMAFVLFDAEDEVMGVAHFAADPDKQRAEYAVLVRSDLKGNGIGRALMQRIIAYGKRFGVGEIFGDVLEENAMMISLCRELGCALAPLSGAAGIVRSSLKL